MKLVISGTTGVGKSTTVNLVKEHYENKGKEVIVLKELVVDSPLFPLYFENLTEYWLPAAMDFLMARFKQWLVIEKDYADKNPEDYVIIYDRIFLEDIIFADLTHAKESKSAMLNEAFIHIYEEVIKMIEEFEKPDFFILLRATFDTVSERQFKIRGREEETSFENKYWQDLYYRYYGSKKYRHIFKEYSKNFVEIDTDDSSPEEVLQKVVKYIENRI